MEVPKLVDQRVKIIKKYVALILQQCFIVYSLSKHRGREIESQLERFIYASYRPDEVQVIDTAVGAVCVGFYFPARQTACSISAHAAAGVVL